LDLIKVLTLYPAEAIVYYCMRCCWLNGILKSPTFVLCTGLYLWLYASPFTSELIHKY
jgi:hypothetical protein